MTETTSRADLDPFEADPNMVPDENGQTPVDIAMTALKAHSLGNSQALHPSHAATLLDELARAKDKMREVAGEETVLFLSDEDRGKAALELDDLTLATLSRWVLSVGAGVIERHAQKKGDPAERVAAMHGTIALALLAFAAKSTLTVACSKVSYKAEEIGDWRVIVEPVPSGREHLAMGFAAGALNRPDDGFKVTHADTTTSTLTLTDPLGDKITVRFSEGVADD